MTILNYGSLEKQNYAPRLTRRNRKHICEKYILLYFCVAAFWYFFAPLTLTESAHMWKKISFLITFIDFFFTSGTHMIYRVYTYTRYMLTHVHVRPLYVYEIYIRNTYIVPTAYIWNPFFFALPYREKNGTPQWK